MSETLSLAHFQKLEKKTGTVKVNDDISLKITLDQVLPKAEPPEGWEIFTLIFTTPAEGILEQAIYPVSFEGAASMDLFLVPVDADKEVVEYEAVFSRRLSTD